MWDVDFSCESLICVGGNDDDCGLSSSVSWTTVPGASYLVYVAGSGGAVGDYGLNIFTTGTPIGTMLPTFPGTGTLDPTFPGSTDAPAGIAEIPYSTGCNTAINLNVPDSVVGFTFAEPTYTGMTCGGVDSISATSPGVWYHVDGTGDMLTVDTCDPTTNFDTIVSLD